MTHRHAFEAVDRTLRDIVRVDGEMSLDNIFGGKTVLLGGDFRQTLHVVPKGRREDVVRASVNKSYVWDSCTIFHLTQNMRIQDNGNFRDWVPDLGNGRLPVKKFDDEDEPYWIQLPPDLIVNPKNNVVDAMVETTYPDVISNYTNIDYIRQRAILTLTNETVDEINSYVLERLPREEHQYFSSDSICKSNDGLKNHDTLYPTEFLNSLSFPGIPTHELALKIGMSIMLRRNINPSLGLYSGTGLIVKRLSKWVIEAEIITRFNIGAKVFVPRIVMSASNPKWSFVLKRRQLPIRVFFAMTINKSQGQTLNHVGVLLPKPVFTHGQLYVAVSRVTNRDGPRFVINNRTLEKKTT